MPWYPKIKLEQKKIVNANDENAFLVIHDVRDVLGNGFINIK